MFHYHILTRNANETIKKIYLKQKESQTKGDWYKILLEDLKFLEEYKDHDEIIKLSKVDYTNQIYS